MAGKFSIEALFKGTDGVSKVIAGVEGRLGRFSSGVSAGLKDITKINDKIIGGLSSIAKHAAVAGALVGAITFAGLSDIVHTGAEFEQTITDVGAVMGKTRGQIGDLEKAAMSLGVTTQFSSTEVAQGMEMMARKGFDAQEILAGIPGVLNAVAASGQDMAEVSTVIGSSIRGFGLAASEAGHVANVLTYVSEKTGAKMLDLGEALATAAPNARLLGVSIEDTAIAVGLLQKIGIPASVSGSSVSVMLSKMAKPSKEAAQEMANLGIKFQDAKGNMLPFRDVLGQFVKASGKAGGNMKQMAFFQELVGNRGEKAAIGLKEMADSGDFDKLKSGVLTVGDYAERVAKMRMDTTMGSWKLLTSTVDVLKIKLFELQGGPLRSIIDNTNKWVTANQDLIVQDVQGFIKGISDKLPKIVTWVERIGLITGVFLSFALAIKVAAGWMAFLTFVASANPWVLLAFSLLALTAVVIAFWPQIKKHQEIIGSVTFVVGVLVLALKGQAMWTAIAGAVTGGVTTLMNGYALATRAGAAASGMATAGLLPLIISLAAVGLAIGAVYLAWTQLTALFKENGDWAGIKAFATGGFSGLNKELDRQAKERSKAPVAPVGADAVPGLGDPMAALKWIMSQQPGAPGAAPIPGMPPIAALPVSYGPPPPPGMQIAGLPPGFPTLPGMPPMPGAAPGAQAASNVSPEQLAQLSGKASGTEIAKAVADALKDSKGEITIKDQTGNATVTKKTAGAFTLRLETSGGM